MSTNFQHLKSLTAPFNKFKTVGYCIVQKKVNVLLFQKLEPERVIIRIKQNQSQTVENTLTNT